jgi:ribosomal protein S18 acetylase RimI-like enzyme
LEKLLPELGYVPDDGALVMTGRLAGDVATSGGDVVDDGYPVHVLSKPLAGWLTAYLTVGEIAVKHHGAAAEILRNIRRPAGFAVASDEHGSPAAVGFAVEEDGWIGMFGVVTRTDQRRRGIGRRLIHSLLNWGRAGGAKNAYLQVVHSNEPAQSLYRQFDFAPAYAYRYWRKQ